MSLQVKLSPSRLFNMCPNLSIVSIRMFIRFLFIEHQIQVNLNAYQHVSRITRHDQATSFTRHSYIYIYILYILIIVGSRLAHFQKMTYKCVWLGSNLMRSGHFQMKKQAEKKVQIIISYTE